MGSENVLNQRIEQIFCDPFDHDKSLQLNRRYWPEEDFKHLDCLAESEKLLKAGKFLEGMRSLAQIPAAGFSKNNYVQILTRFKKLEQSRSSFGHVQGKVDIDPQYIELTAYEGNETRSSYPVSLEGRAQLKAIEKYGVEIHTSSYGYDVTRVSRTVRYAEPDERVEDIRSFGALSDFHNDEYKGITTVCYLSDVNADSGPFQYVPDSHKIPRSSLLNAIHQHVCFDLGKNDAPEMGDLPLEYRATPAIGNFLDPWKEKYLAEQIVSLEGPPGSYVTFNGQYVIHRGGKPEHGYRSSLFLQPTGIFRLKIRSAMIALSSRVNLRSLV